MDNRTVILVDMLNDFVTGDLKCERANCIIPKLKKLVEAFTQEDQEQGLKYLEYVYNAKITTVDKIIAEFWKK